MAAGRTSSADETRKSREYGRGLFELIDGLDRDCETVIKQVNGPAEPDEFYWHLYYRGSKVNGGLVTGTIADARHRAQLYRKAYARDTALASYAWDHETARWISKAERNLR